jgi:type VI secretion system secreted protein VgrG
MPNPGPVLIDSPPPLDPDTLVFRSMVGVEALGRCFEYTIEVTSARSDLAAADLLGSPITVSLERPAGGYRYFNGLLTRLQYLGSTPAMSSYVLVVRPWLWLLTRTADCRIFQNVTVKAILETLFGELHFSDYDLSGIQGDPPEREYVVQYRETDFNFVTRLMDEEGIYYYFSHESGKHTLVLVDSADVHQAPPSTSAPFTLPFEEPDAQRNALIEYVSNWQIAEEIEPGSYAHTDFDPTKSRAKLLLSESAPAGHQYDSLEVFDYPGAFTERSVGQQYAKLRLEERQQPIEQGSGWTNARDLAVGYTFSLQDHPRDDQNRAYLVTAATHHLRGHDIESGNLDGQHVVSTEFQAMPTARQFRSRVFARKPLVGGPQTAIVVGPSGQEIWTDSYGRVKVQFHWDRLGKSNESSSCFVRVSQAWAGSGFGAIHLPRIGQEVVVDFLEGDPDRPIVTGRVYNDANMPPYSLPANQTQSGFKSRSSKGGSPANFNEIRFEDLKGSEEVYVQAEKDLDSLVKNNETRSVGVDRTVKIGHDEALSVGNNRTVSVSANETITVGGNESVTISGNETVSVTGNESVTIGGNETVSVTGNKTETITGSRSRQVGGSETVVVAGAQSIAVAAAQSVAVAGARTIAVASGESVNVAADKSESIGGGLTLSVSGDRSETVGGDDSANITGGLSLTIGKDGVVKGGQSLVFDAADEITLKAGDASITLSKNGDISIKGNNVVTNASGGITLKASSDVVIKGSKVSNN